MGYKLGRVPGNRHPDLPRMAAFLKTVALPPLPPKQDWYSSIADWGVELNNSIGCCTIASVSHMIQQESLYASNDMIHMSDAEVVAGYSAVSGYVPGKPETDRGAYEGAVGQHWLTQGFMCGGQLDRIVGFADINPHDLEELKLSILLTGNCLLGFNLPACAEVKPVWDLPQNPDEARLVGGHAVPAVGWDQCYLYVVSWGRIYPCAWAFYNEYVDEGHVTLSRRWMNSKGTTPAGISWDYLVSASRQFAHGI